MRLEITRKTDLATRALLVLGSEGTSDREKAVHLAERIGTTPGFLSQAMTPLVNRGWVRSDPGPTGGYTTTCDLDNVSVLDVVEAVEGPTDRSRCVLEDRACSSSQSCALHDPWAEARELLLTSLANTPLSSLLTNNEPPRTIQRKAPRKQSSRAAASAQQKPKRPRVLSKPKQ